MLSRTILRVGLHAKVGKASASTLVSSFEKMVSDLPYREAIRYKNGNKKMTAGDVKKHSDSLANGLIEFDFTTGDTIAVWLSESIHKVGHRPVVFT